MIKNYRAGWHVDPIDGGNTFKKATSCETV